MNKFFIQNMHPQILLIQPINTYNNKTGKRTPLDCVISKWSHPLVDQFIIDGKIKYHQDFGDFKTFDGPIIETFFTYTTKKITTTIAVLSLVTQEEYVTLNKKIKKGKNNDLLNQFSNKVLSYLSTNENNPFKAGITYFNELEYADQLDSIFPSYDRKNISTRYNVCLNFQNWKSFFSNTQPDWGYDFYIIHRNGKLDGRWALCHDELLLENTEIDFNSFYELEDSEKYERIHHELKYDAKNKSLQMLKEIYTNYISENIED